MSSPLSEDELIARFFAPYAGPAGLGLRDDAALLRTSPGEDLVLTTDALVAGVHFFADDPPDSIARKALQGESVRPRRQGRASARLPPVARLAARLDRGLARRLRRRARRGRRSPTAARSPAATRSKTPGPLTLSITAFGAVPAGRMAARTGVRPGDRLYVTGTIGDAAIGLRLRQGRGPDIPHADRDFLVRRYLEPRPRYGAGARDGGACATAAWTFPTASSAT